MWALVVDNRLQLVGVSDLETRLMVNRITVKV